MQWYFFNFIYVIFISLSYSLFVTIYIIKCSLSLSIVVYFSQLLGAFHSSVILIWALSWFTDKLLMFLSTFDRLMHYYTSNFEEKISNHETDNLFEYTFEVWSFIWSNHNYKVILEMRPQRPVIKVHSDCFSWLSFYTNIIVIVSSRNLDVKTGLSHTTSEG